MLHINNVTFNYLKRKEPMFNALSMTLEKGCIYGLLGKNATGKSTPLQLLTGMLTPAHGEILFNGINVRKRLPATLRDTFFIPEEFDLPKITLKTYIRIYAPFYPHFNPEEMRQNLRTFEIDERVDLNSLSMGQKKKALICFALAANTPMLIMDEPTNGLDIPGKSHFRKLISTYMNDNKCVIISTHQIRDVDKLLDHILILDGGRMLLNASTTQICDALYFTECTDCENTEEALYTLPSVQGRSAVFLNKAHEESELNVEVLFGAVTSHPDRIAGLFHEKEQTL